MQRCLSAIATLIISAMALAALPASAQTAPAASATSSASATTGQTATQPAKKKAVKKSTKKEAAPAANDEEVREPDVAGTTVIEYQCEMGNKLTIFRNNDDDKHIALKWGKRLHRLVRVDTTTGASRFENHYYGLVWIGIPSKGMLLDSKQGHQLANECKTAEQLAPKAAEQPAAEPAAKE